MTYPYTLSFKSGVYTDKKDGNIILTSGRVPLLRLKNATRGLAAVVDLLSGKGGTEDELCNTLMDEDGTSDLGRFYYTLQKISKEGLLSRTFKAEGRPFATLEPISSYFQFKEQDTGDSVKYCISRFAYCHNDNGLTVLESPLGHGKLILHDWRSSASLNMLSLPCTVSDISKVIPNINEEVVKRLFTFLLNINAICEVGEAGNSAEEDKKELISWEFHDMLFHARSRYGRHGNPVGGTYRFLNKTVPLPAAKPKMAGETIGFFKPDIDKLMQSDIPFTSVIEDRRSIREYAETPVTVEQVGDFLYRCARIREIKNAVPERGLYSSVSNRPYAGGGAIYELELYLTVNRCNGLEKGMYHYCPKDHDLTRITGFNKNLEKLLIEASCASGRKELPDILITYAARFQRLMWKYQSLAYAVILKDVGCLMQHMYLVATAMDLAPCAIGDGDSDIFAEASGLDYYTEGSVGEFILGSKKSC